MRLIFGLLSLLLVLAVAGLLAKTQLASLKPTSLPDATGAAASASAAALPAPQLPQKIKDDVDKLMQQAAQRNDASQ